MDFLHVEHELSQIAVQAYVVLRLQLLQRFHEPRDQCLENVIKNVTFYATSAVAAETVGPCRGPGSGRGHGPRSRWRWWTSGPTAAYGGPHEVRSEVGRVSLRANLRRLARPAFLICQGERIESLLSTRFLANVENQEQQNNQRGCKDAITVGSNRDLVQSWKINRQAAADWL